MITQRLYIQFPECMRINVGTRTLRSYLARPAHSGRRRSVPQAGIRTMLQAAPTAPASPTGEELHRLWVFDFDWTVVDENSDTWIHRCAPGGVLPPAIKDSYVAPDWVGYMNRVLGFLAQQGVTADDLRAKLQVIPWTPGMRSLLEAIADSTTGTPPSAPVAPEALKSTAPVEAAAAALGLPAAGSPPVASEGENEEKVGSGGSAVLPPSPVSPRRFRGPQHAVVLSDANSLFIPWILDGGGGGHGTAVDASSAGVKLHLEAAAGRAAAAAPAVAPVAATPAGVEWPDAKQDGVSTGGCASAAQPRLLSGAFLAILTNPAAVDAAAGAVTVSPHHGREPGAAAPPHACPRCHPNLCKRAALRRLLDEQAAAGVSYRQVVYVGDGRNDLCPCLALRPGDVAMPRVGFALHKLLEPMAAADGTAGSPVPAAATTTSAAAPAQSSGRDSAAGPEGRGDDHVYGSVPPSGTAAHAPGPGGGAAAAAGAGAGARRCGEGGEEGERLRAACVPWVDAYDIIRWVRHQDELGAGSVDATATDGHDLVARAATLTL
ncbi:hypothetical protein PLESTB_001699900 [Pleodorina starrii]|uniref:Uncharacterized protein n=1 Tax=Pleodorina starrii TaxID=330485 RepID=A0A9W6F924_9CHLO|nr:hypothetical protein PLESTB_001699900 [Pleodorina starrii]GLC76738.1 hypothetical protein PLESTF_001825200 [Pleodorina starrii]